MNTSINKASACLICLLYFAAHPALPADSPLPDSAGAGHADTSPQPSAPPESLVPRPGQGFEFIPLPPLRFSNNQDSLDERGKALLDDAILFIKHAPGISRVLIKGHADQTAGEQYNDEISNRRANAVRDYLVSQGVPERLLHTSAHGKTIPVDEGWTPTGKARNRRVEIYVIR